MLQIKLTDVVILVLLVVLLLQRCGGKTETTEPKIVRDTIWVHKDSTILSKPQMVGSIPIPIDRWNTEYLPDTNYTKLLAQYMDVTNKFLASNMHSDSLKIDSIGYVHVKDTVSRNLITSRSYTYNLKYPIIKETITIPEPKKTQVYIGGGFEGDESELVSDVSVGLLLKNKKDQIFGVSVGYSVYSGIQFGISSYWKIKLRK
jgi:hypothetical protein